MEVVFIQNGRLGNAIFRYLACCLLCVKYGYNFKNLSYQQFDITNYNFVSEDIIKDILNGKKVVLGKKLILREFYQHDYINERENIMKYIKSHKMEHIITSDDRTSVKLVDLIDQQINIKQYDIVIHIRMGDFIENIFPYRVIINLKYYYELFDKMDLLNKSIAIVGENPKNKLEKAYTSQLINYFIKKELKVNYETNDILTDFHIIKQAETVVCCMSTFSWTAVFLSDKVKTCYFPDYPVKDENKWITMKKPIKNTIYYKFYEK